jgi:vancomycin resistance protein YoaR
MTRLALLLRPQGRRLVGVFGAAVVGAVVGLSLIFSGTPAGNDRAPALRLLGRELPSGPEAAETALAWTLQHLTQPFTLELPNGVERRIGYDELGVELDRARWQQLTADARLPRSGRTRGPEQLELAIPVQLDTPPALRALLALKDELDVAPQDARLDLDRQAVLPERTGRWLDLDRSLFELRRDIENGSARTRLVFEERTPRRPASQLRPIEHGTLLGFFETPYDAAARAEDRTFNLRLAASKLDGYVLLPGEELDFNDVVGARDEANGYRVAKVIARGELVDGIGGGTCQISGTLHAAALFAGLEIRERHPHTRPSSYIKLGFDAAVVYPTINLRLGNPYDFPVVIRETVEGGRVRAEVRGARRPYAITLLRRIDAAQPYDEVLRPDESLPAGTRVLAQRGVPGFDLHRYRIRRDGYHALRETVVDHYPPTSQLIRVGTGKKGAGAAGRPPTEVPPEYFADELVVLSQQPEPDALPLEQRTPGRFATAGWARTIGAPVWEAKR